MVGVGLTTAGAGHIIATGVGVTRIMDMAGDITAAVAAATTLAIIQVHITTTATIITHTTMARGIPGEPILTVPEGLMQETRRVLGRSMKMPSQFHPGFPRVEIHPSVRKPVAKRQMPLHPVGLSKIQGPH